MSGERLKLIGVTSSPYTQKMIALMRYRQIPYALTWGLPDAVLDQWGVEKPKMSFMPTFVFAGAGNKPDVVNDSTPIIRRLESLYQDRSVLPADPALAFIDYILEDFGDEWVTKYMYHYRWYHAEDADNAGTLLPLSIFNNRLSNEQADEFKHMITERQVSRLRYVGSSDATAPVIESSYRRFLQAMQQHLANQPFLLGLRPGAGDFGIYGQLMQLIGSDPTPRRIAHEESPRTVAWVDLMADLSGLPISENDWRPLEQQPDTLKNIFKEIGRVYVPAMLANAQAVDTGAKEWSAEIDGQQWQQRSFPYQAKCLKWMNEQYQALDDADQARVNEFLAGTDCEALLLTG